MENPCFFMLVDKKVNRHHEKLPAELQKIRGGGGICVRDVVYRFAILNKKCGEGLYDLSECHGKGPQAYLFEYDVYFQPSHVGWYNLCQLNSLTIFFFFFFFFFSLSYFFHNAMPTIASPSMPEKTAGRAKCRLEKLNKE